MKILLISTMYPTPLRPGTKVCHYFTREWVKMGHEVMVIHYRSMFPRIYTDLAGLFPKLAYKYVGNHVEMDRNMNIVEHTEEGIPVFSIPIFKYFPHGAYSQQELNKQIKQLCGILEEKEFAPDAIIGHFHNPQFQIIGALKKIYPQAKTCVSLHELNVNPIKSCYGKKTSEVLDGVDKIGFRSVPIKNRFEAAFGNKRKTLVCWSGTPQYYLTTPQETERNFQDGKLTNFMYVGQTIKRKFPKETVEGVYAACGNDDFKMVFVGSKDIAYPETQEFVNQHGLQDKVSFTGKIPRDEIIKYYDQTECFILISKNEVFGLVYLEAMSRGCIPIAARDEGMEGIIIDGENGFLCEAGNANELAAIIRKLKAMSAEEKKKLSDNARMKAAELSDFNVAKMYLDRVLE